MRIRRRRAKVYEALDPAGRARVEQALLNASRLAEQAENFPAPAPAVWPTANERRCPHCRVPCSGPFCWKCRRDLSEVQPT